MNITHLNIVIFFARPDGSIDHLTGDTSIKKWNFTYFILSFKII